MANVLITGCSSGFGLAMAVRFGRAGDRVFATLRRPAAADALRTAIERERLPVTMLALDVCDPASVTTAIAEAEAASGGLDVVVNNAGIELRSSIEDADDADVRRQFETNVFGPLRVIRAVLPAMRARQRGTIVNVSSVAGIVARPFGGFYSASKHALEAMTEALHFEVQPFGIRVVLVEPGQYGTALLDNAYHGRGFTAASPYWQRSAELDARMTRLVPDGRRADPSEVADIVHAAVNDPAPRLRYLAGQDATMIVTAYRQMDFEQYERAMRTSLDWWD